MIWLTANLGGRVRKVTRNGVDYYVAPATILIPGVLNGSKGSLYYPPEEVRAQPGVWNRIPLTVNHPQDPVTGHHLSANDRGVLSRQGIGFIENDRMERGRRRVDTWFNIARTRAISPAIINALEAGRPIELSTGLYTHNTPVSGTDQRTGRAYDFVARNYRPDHLAILPNQVGACSLSDGCGVFNSAPRFPTKSSRAALKASQEAVEYKGESSRDHGPNASYALKIAGHATTAADRKQASLGAKYHSEAATEHRKAADRERDLGYHEAAAVHDKAAKAHEQARDELGRFTSNRAGPKDNGCGDGG